MKRVNLGSGRDYKSGWVNVDAFPDYKADVLADLSKPFPFPDNSIDELLASDILEHFTKQDGEQFLQECHRVLRKEGLLTIRTHNVYQIFQQFSKDPEVLLNFLYGNTDESGVFGAHKYGYTELLLRRKLAFFGFKILSIEKEETNFLVKVKKEDVLHDKLTIGVIQQTPDMGGAESYMLSLMEAFQKHGETVVFATNLERFEEAGKKCTLKTFHIPFILDVMGNWKGLVKAVFLFPRAIIFYGRLLSMYKKHGVNVLLMSGFSEKMLVTFLSQFYHIPVVWIEYGSLDTIFPRNYYLPKVLYRLLKSIPKFVIIPTKNTARSLMLGGRVSQAKLIEIPCGVDTSRQGEGKLIELKELKNKFVIGNVSRLTREKGQDVLIKAFAKIRQSIPHAHLLLVGDGPDKAYFTELVAQLGISNSVTLTGYVSNVSSYYDCMNVFVFPTVWDLEGFGLVSIEAMLHKIPVIASAIGPVPEIIDDERTGLLIPPSDEKSILKAVERLHANKILRDELVRNAYEKVMQKYTIETVSNQLLEKLYEATFA